MLKLVLIKTECGEILGLGHSQIHWELGGNPWKDAGDVDSTELLSQTEHYHGGKITKTYPCAHQGILINELKDYYGNAGKI